MKTYIIDEDWKVWGYHEHYHNEIDVPGVHWKSIKQYITDWIIGWKESCEENEYKITKIVTDYKTKCTVYIKTDSSNDIMKMKIKEKLK